jgi:glucose-6-phosphate 1-dehydrogenase
MNDCLFIILGASGDLTKRKLVPALYKLIADKKIEKFVMVGAAVEAISIDSILDSAKPFVENSDPKIWQILQEASFYQQLDFCNKDDFSALHETVTKLEKKYNLSGNRIIYLAAASQFYSVITEHLSLSGLAKKFFKGDKTIHQIVYEKPFGHDLQSAHQINECIAASYDEKQIYRIDHYLTKELVGNIALMRFTNAVLEPLWDNRFIDNVQIVLSEKVGIEDRGAYYDNYGALKDMVQNHMLELVALIGMESPEWLSGEHIRTERARVLEKIRIIDVVLGQYEGYKDEKYVDQNSVTETFALVCLMIDNPRWAGVPFYLKTGKCLDKKETVIHIKFKQVDCLLARSCPSESNHLTIQIFPEAIFSMSLNVKKPGVANEVIPVKMEFCHSCMFGTVTPEAYEVIFEEILRRENSISVRFDEIESAWKVIDTIKSLKASVHTYKKGGKGPREMEDFAKKHGMRWRS